MKKYICILCSLAIGIAGLTGCNRSGNNPFTAENAIKGQLGELYYVVPENAAPVGSVSEELAMYDVPIENSTEEYQLTILYKQIDNTDEYELALENIEDSIEQIDIEDDIEVSTEEINIFLGKAIDKGYKREGKVDGKKTVGIVALKSDSMYMVGYTAKTGFFDQSVWDNFYEQLKLV